MLTFKHGADLPDTQAPEGGKLPKGELQKEQRDATKHQHDEVWEHEGTCNTQMPTVTEPFYPDTLVF